MKKEKFHIEYVFDKISKRSLWNHITTPPGLSSWFADSVDIDGNTYVFSWDKLKETANVVYLKPDVCIRYRWEDDDENVYFEFRVNTVELTGDVTLEITDFAEPSEKMDSISLWESQVEELKRTLGV
ncbi:MAG: hypothetical protein LBT42_05680 [Tannerella sp.]|jgi:uncharacterized protein YndB with AHSA1/START domain|nr:hypothetical protein [Tannerella sp.]